MSTLCINYVQDSVIDQLHELIFEYLNIHAHTLGFPELALPILMEVRNIMLMLLLVCLTVLFFSVSSLWVARNTFCGNTEI